MATITFEDVTKTYPDGTEAVCDLDLQIGDGEFMVFVGPSGCGKSTALKMVAGLEGITDGAITIGDQVVNELPPKDRDIAMVFQDYALYPHMTVYDNMAFSLKVRKFDKADIRRRVHDAAVILGIEDLLDRRPKALSGGQRQRVAMGRAIVREPEVFLLDEPLSNLDAKLRVEMRAELKRLQDRVGVTTIYVTHDQVEAMTLGERIAVLSDGILQQVGSPQDVYDHPANVFVAGFIGSPPMNLLRGTATGGRVVAGDLELEDAHVADGDVVVGIRPEALHPANGGHPGPGLEVRVDVVEPLGDEVLVHGSVEASGADARRRVHDATLLADAVSDRGTVRLRLPPRERPSPGSTLHLTVAPEEVHLFDDATGLAVRRR